ncbi:hypothetical protein DXG01_008933 [Tephrocybe rancida]|nr:hypothetical protein DXG01_008933 [Tephrocybe rancida]
MLDITPQLAAATILSLLVLGSVFIRRPNTDAINKLPPGPPGLPILGNVLQVPGKHLATYFRGLLEEYGGLVSLNLAGFPVILIGDIKVAKDLLDKHSIKHSSRPVVPYIAVGRKLTVGVMSSVRVGKTEPLHEFEALLNVQKLLDDGGKDWFHHMKR